MGTTEVVYASSGDAFAGGAAPLSDRAGLQRLHSGSARRMG